MNATSLDGNRIWRVPTSDGRLVQKLYAGRRGLLRRWLRYGASALFPVKTSSSPAGRFRTERLLLRRWRDEGFDVPDDLTDDRPDLAGPLVLVMEFVDGPPLGRLLASGETAGEARAALLRRFAGAWSRRHARALEAGDVRLVQLHATIDHVLVAGDRLVSIDLERHQRARSVLPPVAREIGDVLRSLRKRVGAEAFRQDLATIVEAYPRRDILRAAVAEVRRSGSALRRLVWAVDRFRMRNRKASKYAALEALGEELSRSCGE